MGSKPAGRIPSLDGLRAISIVLVILGHLAGTKNSYSLELIRPFGDLGNFGVRVFFVISGFLITTLLLEEHSKTGKISLKSFYLRRFFRIFPPFYAYIGVIAAASALGWVVLRPGDVLHAVTYTVNYHYDRSWWFGHIWSLSVEEQFYLLWPAILVFAGIRWSVVSAVAVLVLSPAIRLAYWHLLPDQHAAIGEAFPTISDALAAGCVLAGVRGRLDANRRYLDFIRSRWFYLVPAVAFAANLLGSRPRLSMVFGQTVMNVALAVVVDRFVRYPESAGGRILNLRPFEYVGMLSYSIYLWQQPFLDRHSSSAVTAFPLNILLVAAISPLSFYLVERPFLNLRRRVETARR